MGGKERWDEGRIFNAKEAGQNQDQSESESESEKEEDYDVDETSSAGVEHDNSSIFFLCCEGKDGGLQLPFWATLTLQSRSIGLESEVQDHHHHHHEEERGETGSRKEVAVAIVTLYHPTGSLALERITAVLNGIAGGVMEVGSLH